MWFTFVGVIVFVLIYTVYFVVSLFYYCEKDPATGRRMLYRRNAFRYKAVLTSGEVRCTNHESEKVESISYHQYSDKVVF
jgi:hypothetical protein